MYYIGGDIYWELRKLALRYHGVTPPMGIFSFEVEPLDGSSWPASAPRLSFFDSWAAFTTWLTERFSSLMYFRLSDGKACVTLCLHTQSEEGPVREVLYTAHFCWLRDPIWRMDTRVSMEARIRGQDNIHLGLERKPLSPLETSTLLAVADLALANYKLGE